MSEAGKDFSKAKAFLIDMTKCTGCRGCQVACKQWNQLDAEKTTFFTGEGYQNPPLMSEHTFTRIKFKDYQKNGENEFAFYKEMCMHCNEPACATACPTAITYGTRGDMLKEAEKRLKSRPERYFQAIYGKEEAGGTSILYLTHQPLDELGFKKVTKRPLPSYTWQALRLVPGIFLTVGGSLSAVSWFQHRKARIRAEEEAEKQQARDQKEEGK